MYQKEKDLFKVIGFLCPMNKEVKEKYFEFKNLLIIEIAVMLLYYFVQVRPDFKPDSMYSVPFRRWMITLRTPESIGMWIK